MVGFSCTSIVMYSSAKLESVAVQNPESTSPKNQKPDNCFPENKNPEWHFPNNDFPNLNPRIYNYPKIKIPNQYAIFSATKQKKISVTRNSISGQIEKGKNSAINGSTSYKCAQSRPLEVN